MRGHQHRLAPQHECKLAGGLLAKPLGDVQLANPHPRKDIHAITANRLLVGGTCFGAMALSLESLAEAHPSGALQR